MQPSFFQPLPLPFTVLVFQMRADMLVNMKTLSAECNMLPPSLLPPQPTNHQLI